MDSSIFGYSFEDFKEEAKELLLRAEGILSELEAEPSDLDRINALFRTIHSLKGSAAYVGLPEVNDFSHLYESTLGELRGKRRQCDLEVVSVLTRSRDYLEDLIFHADDTDVVALDDSIEDPFERLRNAFGARKGAAASPASPTSKVEAQQESPNSNEESAPPAPINESASSGAEPDISPGQSPDQSPDKSGELQVMEEGMGEEVNVSTDDHSEMDETDVIKITVKKSIESLYDVLGEVKLDKDEATRVLDKLEETVQWAFGDEAIAVMIPIEEMKGLLAEDFVGIEEVAKLKQGYNMLVPALKKELRALDGVMEEAGEEAGSVPLSTIDPDGAQAEMMEDTEEAEEMRGASRDEIVWITLETALKTLDGELSIEVPDGPEIRKLINKLRDLNQWVFDEDDEVTATLNSMEDLLVTLHDGNSLGEIKNRARSVGALLKELAEEKMPAYGAGAGEGVSSKAEPDSEPEAQDVPRAEAAGGIGTEVHEDKGSDEAAAPSAREAAVTQTERGESREGPRRGRKGPRRSWAPVGGSTLRVRTEDVESLINTVGDLSALDPKDFERLHAATLELRMVHVGELFSRFRKVVRDLSEDLDKEIDIEITGESVKLDKAIADKLGEPLMHMIRNAASHGIESPAERRAAGKGRALLRLNAYQEGGQVIIQLSDNGGGIDVARVRKRADELGLTKGIEESALTDKRVIDFIFAPGFSTKDSADSVSGRGVGMDVVKEVVGSLQGTVSIDTVPGEGTTFMLQLPLTLAVIRGMVLEQAGNKIAVPAGSVDRIMSMTEQELTAGTFMDKNRLSLYMPDEGEIIPLVNFCTLFGLEKKSDKRCVVLVKVGGGHKVALIVDAAIGRQPLVVKPLDRYSETRYFSSASIVEGEVVLILNVPSLHAA